MSFSNNLKLAMNYRKVKNIDLIKKCNIGKNQIKYWENNQNSPKMDKLSDISLYLDVPVALLTSENLSIDDIIDHDNKKIKKQIKKDINAMSEATKAIASEQLANSQLAATAMEQTLLDAFRGTTDEGRMAILEAALKAKIANDGSDVAIAKKDK